MYKNTLGKPGISQHLVAIAIIAQVYRSEKKRIEISDKYF